MEADNHELKDGVAYIGWKETNTIVQLYKWTDKAAIQDFDQKLMRKLKRPKRTEHDEDTMSKPKMREYLQDRVPSIAQSLNLTLVTDFARDHLLTVKRDQAYFVYFGAMTKDYIHVACWLRVPLRHNTIDNVEAPKIFFWVLHTSYAQELEALGDLVGENKIEINNLRKLLDLSDGIDYDLQE